MDAERALVSKIAIAGGLEDVIARGVEEHHFLDQGCRKAWRTMVDHMRAYRTPASFQRVKDMNPDFGFEIVQDALEFVMDEFMKSVKRRFAIEAFRDLSDLLDDEKQIGRIEEVFLEKARDLAAVIPSTHVAKFSQMQTRVHDYQARKASGIMLGTPFGIPQIDDLTFGFQPHEFVSIAGWQGTGKSTLLQMLAFNAYLAGKTPMIASLEMEAEALYRKFDTMAVGFEYRALKAMELGEGDLAAWEKAAERASNAKNDIIVLDDLGRCTVEKVYAETVRYKPDMVGVDYMSLMDTPKSNSLWEAVTYVTRGLKQNARTLRIPVFGVAQTNIASAEAGARLDNIAYSRSIGQDSDIVFGLHCDEEMRENKQMQLRMLKNRDGRLATVNMFWDPAFGQFREWRASDMFAREA